MTNTVFDVLLWLYYTGILTTVATYIIMFVRSKWKSNQVQHIADICQNAVNWAATLPVGQDKRNAATQKVYERMNKLGLTKHSTPAMLDGFITGAVNEFKALQAQHVTSVVTTTPTPTYTTSTPLSYIDSVSQSNSVAAGEAK